MPDLSHLWNRFVLALTLVFGLAVGVAATIFGYSNTGTVNVGFALWNVSGIPLWTVALGPLAVALVVGTLYHWWNSLHHFSEHMRHRRRVRDLETEVATLKERLDHLLEMPDHGATPKPAPAPEVVPVAGEEEAAEKGAAEEESLPVIEPVVLAGSTLANGAGKGETRPAASRKRVSLKAAAEPEPAAAGTNGENGAPALDSTEEANS